MSQTMTLELPSEIYEAVRSAASTKGLHPAEWIIDNLRRQFISPPPGSPQAILQALKEAPRVSPEDVDALEQAIKEGEIPVDWTSIFEESEEEKP
jgi:hypothetical protein